MIFMMSLGTFLVFFWCRDIHLHKIDQTSYFLLKIAW